MKIDTNGKTHEELMVEVSHLYRALMHEAPVILFREKYKGTPETPNTLRNRHEYTCEVGMFMPNEKGHQFLSLRSGGGTSYEAALLSVISSINAAW